MPILYNSKKLIPAPFISIEKEYIRGEDGSLRRPTYVVTATGTLLAYKGSPDASGVFWTSSGYPPDTSDLIANDPDKRLAIFRDKIGAMQQLFCEKGFLFEVQPYDGSLSIKFIPRVKNISFPQGNPGGADWFTKINYTIVMETDEIDFGTFTLCASEGDNSNDIDETWQVEPNDNNGRTYKIIHNVSAQAKDEYDSAGTGTLLRQGWVVARDDKVSPALGFDTAIRDGSLAKTLDAFVQYNYIKNETIDETGGKYSIVENWVLFDGGPYLEEYTVSTKNAIDGQVSVTIDGSIAGYSTSTEPGTGDRYTNAGTGLTTVQAVLITRAQTYSGVTLNAIPINTSIGKNPIAGTITYNYEYSNRPSATISGAVSENVTVSDDLPVAKIAVHICVLRTIGPVLQDIETKTESNRSLSIDVQMPAQTTSTVSAEPDVTSIITTYTPVATYEGPYIQKNSKTWNPQSGKFSRTISWIWV